MFIETLCQTFQEDAQYRLHAWRKTDYSLWNSSLPDGACGWYTIANLHRRARGLPLLDFTDQRECQLGAHILQEVARHTLADAELHTKLSSAYRWISSDRLSPFRAQDQLSSIDFAPINRDISTAIYMTPPFIDSPRMHSEEWILLYHYTIPPLGSSAPTFTELLQLAQDSNYAQLVDHHFWPIPALQHEDARLQQALVDLAGNIWNFLASLQYQGLLMTSH